MSILDKVQIGNSVQVNLELSKDRLPKEIIDSLSTSSVGTICDFRITDGKGIGVILKLSNGKEQWFFENEIEVLDDDGRVIEQDINKIEDINFIVKVLNDIKYENKNEINVLVNPINFFIWLLTSLKDNF